MSMTAEQSIELRKLVERTLDQVSEIVSVDRCKEYGPPQENHGRTAQLWSVALGMEVTPEQVCLLNILQKCSRACVEITDDTVLDIAGYAVNLAVCRDAS